jgi:predicted acetyltransferase
MFARTGAWWRDRALADPDARRLGRGELQCVLLEVDGRPAAYALYRLTLTFDAGISTGALDVVEAMGDSPRATRAVWQYLLEVDWMAKLRAWLLPADHELLHLVAEPRRLRMRLRDGLWVRLVDVEAALRARTYTGERSVVIEVTDAFCPWNAGRWHIGGDGVRRTTDPPDLRGDVTALAAVYLGGFTWGHLARALRVEPLRDDAIPRADSLFRTPRAPWCAEIF